MICARTCSLLFWGLLAEGSLASVQVDYSPFEPGSLPQARIGRCQNPYFRHGDALYPLMYAAFVGWLCHIRIFPRWLILLLLSPMYVGGVQLVIVRGERGVKLTH